MTREELIKERRAQPWRAELRKASPNKERITAPRTPMPTLGLGERLSSFHHEVALGYTAELAMEEARRCLDCPSPGCVSGCPVGIHIPSFIKLIERGEFVDALGIIRETSSLPAVCGRVCPQEKQCESQCIYTLSLKKPAVSIGNLERFVADYERLHPEEAKPLAPPMPPNGLRVAVIGSGPAGISFATDMAKWGYEVTVYEGAEELGGVLRYGIPEFVLPNSIIEHELAKLRQLGVHFVTSTYVGQDVTVQQLQEEGFAGIFVATGAGVPNFMHVPGEDLKGVHSASDYLARLNMMSPEEIAEEKLSYAGKRVAIIGAGNTAIDAVRSALRLGAAEVMIVYRRSREEMPARAEELHHAEEEGTRFLTLHNPIAYLADDSGHVARMRLQQMQLGEPDASGRRSPHPIEGAIVELEVDEVIVSIGYSASPLVPQSLPELSVSRSGTIVVDEEQRSSIPTIYAGGDIVRGPATVILAMGDGRRAATAMHRSLTGRTELGALV